MSTPTSRCVKWTTLAADFAVALLMIAAVWLPVAAATQGVSRCPFATSDLSSCVS